MARTKSTAAIKAAASTLETALKSLAISSSASDTHGVSIDTPTSSASSQVARIASYFDCFAGFEANNAAPIRDEFNRLATHQKWSKKSETYKEQRLICLTMEFDRCYGHLTSTNLEAWQGLCSEIMPDASIPTSINQCKKLLSKVYVNIYDYIDCKRAGIPPQPVFKNFSKFAKHTVPDNIFPLKAAKNVPAYKALLERVFARMHK